MHFIPSPPHHNEVKEIAPHTCCPIIPLANAVNGSTTSLNPSGLNILHLCFSTNDLSFGSTLHRNSCASSNSVSTVEFPVFTTPTSGGGAGLAGVLRFLLGEAFSVSCCWEEGAEASGLMGEDVYAVTREPPGVDRGALVV
jgi:hypothetical protein